MMEHNITIKADVRGLLRSISAAQIKLMLFGWALMKSGIHTRLLSD